jgi:hypothetical protein
MEKEMKLTQNLNGERNAATMAPSMLEDIISFKISQIQTSELFCWKCD